MLSESHEGLTSSISKFKSLPKDVVNSKLYPALPGQYRHAMVTFDSKVVQARIMRIEKKIHAFSIDVGKRIE